MTTAHSLFPTTSFEQHSPFYAPDDSIYVDPTAQIGTHVTLSPGVRIGAYCIIEGNVTIGPRTRISSHVVIGTAQDRSVSAPMGHVIIGADVVIREFVTINCPTAETRTTEIGDRCYLMHFAHVAHDAHLEENVIMTNHAQIAGHAYIEHDALLMAGAMVHQRCRVGAYSGLAPRSGCRLDIPPYGLYTETPALFAGIHAIKLKRSGIDGESRLALKEVTKLFYHEKLSITNLLERIKNEPWGSDRHVQAFVLFIEQSARGVSRATIREHNGDLKGDFGG